MRLPFRRLIRDGEMTARSAAPQARSALRSAGAGSRVRGYLRLQTPLEWRGRHHPPGDRQRVVAVLSRTVCPGCGGAEASGPGVGAAPSASRDGL